MDSIAVPAKQLIEQLIDFVVIVRETSAASPAYSPVTEYAHYVHEGRASCHKDVASVLIV